MRFHLPHLRFSLLTLVLAVLLIGSTATLWWHWQPWGVEHTFRGRGEFSPDGRRIVTIDNYLARAWDPYSGAELVVLGHRLPVRSASFSPDSCRIVTSCTDNTARIWDAQHGAELAILRLY